MKTLNFFGISISFIFVSIFCLAAFCGCGDTGDESGHSSVSLVSGDESGHSREYLLSEKFKWPAGATGELWELPDADVAELLAITPPADWPQTADPELRRKYRFAQLLKQFGDIPELRYIIAYERKPKNITIEQAIAVSEAMYRLFPNEINLKALRDIRTIAEELRSPQYRPKNELDKNELEVWVERAPVEFELGVWMDAAPVEFELEVWMDAAPVEFIDAQRLLYVEKYGDIPEVHTYLNLLLKQLLGQILTAAERQEMNAARLHLNRLEQGEANPDDNDD